MSGVNEAQLSRSEDEGKTRKIDSHFFPFRFQYLVVTCYCIGHIGGSM